METGIHVGNKIDAKEAVGPIAQAVMDVLEAISEYRIDRETGLKALDVIAMASGANCSPTSLSNCCVTSAPRPADPPRTVYDEDDGCDR